MRSCPRPSQLFALRGVTSGRWWQMELVGLTGQRSVPWPLLRPCGIPEGLSSQTGKENCFRTAVPSFTPSALCVLPSWEVLAVLWDDLCPHTGCTSFLPLGFPSEPGLLLLSGPRYPAKEILAGWPGAGRAVAVLPHVLSVPSAQKQQVKVPGWRASLTMAMLGLQTTSAITAWDETRRGVPEPSLFLAWSPTVSTPLPLHHSWAGCHILG